MKLKPIKTRKEYNEALKQIDKLLDSADNSQNEEKLELLSILVEAYENEHYPIEAPDPIEAIKFAMEQRGFSNKDLESCIGSRARVSEVMNRKRPLTLRMIRNLHGNLHIPAEVLIQNSISPS